MFGWIKKRILKSLAKDIVKNIPIWKEEGLKLIEEHKDEVIEKIKQAVKKAVLDFVDSKVHSLPKT